MRKFKILAVCFAAVLLSAFFTGCYSEFGNETYDDRDNMIGLTASYEEDASHYYVYIDLDLPMRVYSLLNSSSLQWNLDTWLNSYLGFMAEEHGFIYEMDKGNYSGGYVHYYAVQILVPKSSKAAQMFDPQFTILSDNLGFFFRSYTAKQKSMYSSFLTEYQEVAERKASGTLNKEDYLSMSGVLLNGYRVYNDFGYSQLLPSLKEAFGSVLPVWDKSKFFLDQYVAGSFRFTNSDGMYKESGQDIYYYERTLDKGSYDLEMETKRMNPVGWYIVTIVLGLGITCLILFVAIKKKKNPKQYTNIPTYLMRHDADAPAANPFGEEYIAPPKKAQIDPFAEYFTAKPSSADVPVIILNNKATEVKPEPVDGENKSE